MANRKKRLGKGIESLEKQIELHREKLRKAKEGGKIDLEGYYEKELKHLAEYKDRKKRQLEN